MEIKSINKNLGFGTAFVSFDQDRFDDLPEKNQIEVTNLLTKDLKSEMCDGFTKYTGSNKQVLSSAFTGKTTLHFTDENPENEKQLVNKFKELFQNYKISTEVIPNTPYNKARIDEAKEDQMNSILYFA